ncbi:hypothetical protein NA78x_000007 [Anatilimnocola sp. NA78]|uniref:hypothetical protein n=1 Tax=Anatilimnocola sp. NA78 TaxID=3415683 RepID=UPI003CE4C2F8
MPPADQTRPLPESTGAVIVRRILVGLGCAALVGALALGQPFACYYVSLIAVPDLFGSEYPLLAPIIVAVIGVLGAPWIGLVAGAAAPNRWGAAFSLAGLAVFQLATMLYLLTFHIGPNEANVVGFLVLLVPGAIFNLILAAACALSSRVSNTRFR